MIFTINAVIVLVVFIAAVVVVVLNQSEQSVFAIGKF